MQHDHERNDDDLAVPRPDVRPPKRLRAEVVVVLTSAVWVYIGLHGAESLTTEASRADPLS